MATPGIELLPDADAYFIVPLASVMITTWLYWLPVLAGVTLNDTVPLLLSQLADEQAVELVAIVTGVENASLHDPPLFSKARYCCPLAAFTKS